MDKSSLVETTGREEEWQPSKTGIASPPPLLLSDYFYHSIYVEIGASYVELMVQTIE